MVRYILINTLVILLSLPCVVEAQLPYAGLSGKITYEYSFQNYGQSKPTIDTLTLYYWNDPVSHGYNSLLFKNDSFLELVEGWRKTTRIRQAGKDSLFLIELNKWFLGGQSSLKYFPNLGIREVDSFNHTNKHPFESSLNSDSTWLTIRSFTSDTFNHLQSRFYLEKIFSLELGVYVYDSSYYSEFGEEQILTYRMLDFDGSFFENRTFETFRDSVMQIQYANHTVVDYELFRKSYLKKYRQDHQALKIGDTFKNLNGWIDIEGDTINFQNLMQVVANDSSDCQLLILDFFYLACAPCMMLLNELSDLNEIKLFSPHIQWVSVNVYKDDPLRLKKYFNVWELNHPVLLQGERLLKGYEQHGFPMTIVLNRAGIVEHVSYGYYESFLNDLAEELNELVVKD